MVRQDLMGNAGMEMLHKIVHAPRDEGPCDGRNLLMAKADWAGLKRDGFTVIRGFCSAEEVRTMKELYEAIPSNENKNYAAKNAEFPPAVMKRFKELLPYIRTRAEIPVDQVCVWDLRLRDADDRGRHSRHSQSIPSLTLLRIPSVPGVGGAGVRDQAVCAG